MLALAAPDASAQVPTASNENSFPTTCGAFGGGGGGAEGWIETGGGVNLIISDALTGEKLWPRAPGAFEIPNRSSLLDLTLDTNDGDASTTPVLTNGRLFLPQRFYVLTFIVQVKDGQTFHIAWAGAGGFGAPSSFYNPVPSDGNIDTCFHYVRGDTPDADEIEIATHDVSTAGGGAGYVNSVLGDDGWTLPYDGFALCPAGGCLTEAQRAGATLSQFVSYKANVEHVPGAFGGGYRLLPDFRIATAVRVPASYPALSWSVPNLALRFAPIASLATAGVLNAAGTTFTAANPSLGWGGLSFEPSSYSTLTGVTVRLVSGPNAVGRPVTPLASHAISLTNSAGTFTDLVVRDPIPNTGSVDGVYTSGLDAFGRPVVLNNPFITGMSGSAVVANGGGRFDIYRGTLEGNSGTAVVSGGSSKIDVSKVYLAPATPGTPGVQITNNPGGGVDAVSPGVVLFSAPGQGDGFATVALNGGRGLTATGYGAIYAGTESAYRKNRIYNNAPGNPSGNVFASGPGSRVYAGCNWWNQETFPYRTGAVDGGVSYIDRALARDPYAFPNDACGGTIGREAPQGGTAARGDAPGGGDDGVAGRSSMTALLRLVGALDAATPAETVDLLAALVADEPDTEEAAAALGEVGGIASRAGAPAGADALLVSALASPVADLRVAAAQALVASRQAQNDHTGALAAADALAAEGGAAVVQAELARVYLYGEAEDVASAEAALRSLETLAPEGREVVLARAYLAGEEAPLGQRSAPTEAPDAAKATLPEALAETSRGAGAPEALAVWPNPAGGAASLGFALGEASDVTVTEYDLLGRVVAQPVGAHLAAGAHRADAGVSGLAPGVYVVRLVAGARAETVRFTVAR